MTDNADIQPLSARTWLYLQKLRHIVEDPCLYLGFHGENLRKGSRPHGGKTLTGYGQNIVYLLLRLKRDSPEILDRLLAGEYRSVNEAARVAGILRNPTALDKALLALKKVADEDVAVLAKEVRKRLRAIKREEKCHG